MSCEFKISSCTSFADSSIALMARIENIDDPYLSDVQVADITSITAQLYDVTDEDNRTAIGDEETLTVADVIFDELQTDSRWSKDSEGYNFFHFVTVPEIDTTYEYRITLTTATEVVIVWAYKINAK